MDMKTITVPAALLLAATALLLATTIHAEPPAQGAPPTDPNFKFSKEDFGVGRKHTPNAWCNKQIDKLLDEVRDCFNSNPATECEALKAKNTKKMGGYIKNPRCQK
jgi:hypothetical protein